MRLVGDPSSADRRQTQGSQMNVSRTCVSRQINEGRFFTKQIGNPIRDSPLEGLFPNCVTNSGQQGVASAGDSWRLIKIRIRANTESKQTTQAGPRTPPLLGPKQPRFKAHPSGSHHVPIRTEGVVTRVDTIKT